MTGTRSSLGVIPQVCVLHCFALCENVHDDWDLLFVWCDPTGMCVAGCYCCTVLHCVKTCTITGTALHCVALVALRQNVYDIWYLLFAWCDFTGMYVAVCCSVLYCVEKFTMTGTRSSSGVIPQVCVLRCVALCENVVDDWKSIFAWDYATVMCVALCCGVLRCCAICENVCDVCDGSFRLKVSFAKEPYNRDYILQKRPMI